MSAVVTTLWISLGGALGTAARYWFAVWVLPFSRTLPFGTIGINIIGLFIIGFIGTLTLASARHPLPETARLFVMVGICGGSSCSLQTLHLLRSGAWTRALLNIALSVLLCLLAVAAGHAVTAHLNGGARAMTQAAIKEEA
jgi:CrcB protein